MSHLDHPALVQMQEYRAKALQAYDKAAQSKDPHVSASWKRIGDSYHDMAERLGRKIEPWK